MSGHVHGEGEGCSCVLHAPAGTTQTLEEMDFDRGLWSAAMNGEVGRVEKLLSTGSSPKAVDSAGYTPLHYASRSGHTHVCRLLLASGADVNAQTPGGVAPLHRAAYCGHTEVVQLLLQHKANVMVTDSDGRTPLHKAAEKRHLAVVELLVSASPDAVPVRDMRGNLAWDLIKAEDAKLRELLKLS